jgi:hypothetical protein
MVASDQTPDSEQTPDMKKIEAIIQPHKLEDVKGLSRPSASTA